MVCRCLEGVGVVEKECDGESCSSDRAERRVSSDITRGGWMGGAIVTSLILTDDASTSFGGH